MYHARCKVAMRILYFASEYFYISINNLQLFYEGGLLCVKI
jgi:hypothetical protein